MSDNNGDSVRIDRATMPLAPTADELAEAIARGEAWQAENESSDDGYRSW